MPCHSVTAQQGLRCRDVLYAVGLLAKTRLHALSAPFIMHYLLSYLLGFGLTPHAGGSRPRPRFLVNIKYNAAPECNNGRFTAST